MSLDFLHARSLAAKDVMGHVVTDTPEILRIRQTGSKAVTSVTTTTATNIVLIDSDGTTTSTFATDTTMGAVRATIAAASNWDCRILDGLAADASASQLVTGAITVGTFDGVLYYDALGDTSASLQFAYRLSQDRHVGQDKPKGSHRVHLNEIKYSVNMGTAAVDSVQIWECGAGTTETQLAGYLSVDTTATTINFASGNKRLSSGENKELVVLIKDAGTLADAGGNYMDVHGTLE